MEVASLAFGVAGLAGLFTSCLEAVNIVQSYQTFRTDSHVLNTRFKVAKALFEQWGLRVGIEQGRLLPHHHPGLDDKTTSATVMELLHIIIKVLCDESNAPLYRTGVAGGHGGDQTYAGMPGSSQSMRCEPCRLDNTICFGRQLGPDERADLTSSAYITQIAGRSSGVDVM
jgi:hypothetical protein